MYFTIRIYNNGRMEFIESEKRPKFMHAYYIHGKPESYYERSSTISFEAVLEEYREFFANKRDDMAQKHDLILEKLNSSQNGGGKQMSRTKIEKILEVKKEMERIGVRQYDMHLYDELVDAIGNVQNEAEKDISYLVDEIDDAIINHVGTIYLKFESEYIKEREIFEAVIRYLMENDKETFISMNPRSFLGDFVY